jgi:NADH-quinone oxidoreductase subunit M
MRTLFSRLWLVVALALATSLGASPAFAAGTAAAGARHAGRIALSLSGGGSGPLVLAPGQGGWIGTLTITNVGAEPLIVSRVAIRGDEDDVRSPSRLSVHFVDGAATSATLPPGTSKDVLVAWMPDRNPRVRQAFGHVVVTSTDEEAGEVAMGFRAELPTGLGWIGAHVLSLLVLLPLVVVLVAGAARLAGRRDAPLVRRAALAVGVVELLLALWAYLRFAPDVGRADGNDGFQLVDRAVWVRSIGAEWYLGVDGTSIPLVLLAAVLGLVSVVLVPGGERRTDGYYAATALLACGLAASFVALDLVLLFAAWQLVLVALVMLVGGWGGARGAHAAAKLATYGAIGSSAMLAVLIALSRASGHTFLVDGTMVAHTMSIPELARTSFASRGPILGVPFVEGAWVLLFVAVAVATPIVPLHGWLPEALEEAPAGAAILLGGAVVAMGPYLLVRVGLGAMPEGARWAGASIAALGVLGVVYGSVCAMAQRDLRKFVAYASVASSGACLFGVGAFTPQGIAGAVAGMFAHGLAAAMLLGVVAAVELRLNTCALERLGGLGTETPAVAGIVGVGLAVSLGVPGLVGFWGPLLALLGGFVRHPVLAVWLAGSLVVSAAAHLRVARMVLFGRVDPAWRRSAYLEPFGGRIPDALPRELAAFVPLAVLALLLGLWPAPLLSPMASGVRDASAAVDPAGPDPSVDAR